MTTTLRQRNRPFFWMIGVSSACHAGVTLRIDIPPVF
jgi:hypothetical protein